MTKWTRRMNGLFERSERTEERQIKTLDLVVAQGKSLADMHKKIDAILDALSPEPQGK